MNNLKTMKKKKMIFTAIFAILLMLIIVYVLRRAFFCSCCVLYSSVKLNFIRLTNDYGARLRSRDLRNSVLLKTRFKYK